MKKFYTYMGGLIFFCLSRSLSAQTLSWEIPKNERLEIIRTAAVKQSLNTNVIKNYFERNIINLTCYEKGSDGSLVKGTFTVYQKDEGTEIFRKIEEFFTDFKILTNGKFIVDRKYLMPNLRHIPTFPLKKISQGESWKEEGEIFFTNFPQPFFISFPVTYKLTSIKKIDDTEVAVIDYSFHINKNFNRNEVFGMPLKIIGKNNGTLFWDITHKRPYKMDDSYFIQFIFADSPRTIASANFAMEIKTQFTMFQPQEADDKMKAIKDIKSVLPKSEDIRVEEDEQGIAIRLGEVLFDFDSYQLKIQALKDLDAIAKIIREKYPHKEIIVEGHTDNIGSAEYNKNLSEKRAYSVAKYLHDKGLGGKLSYRGYGMEKPLFDNKIPEGRSKNRRVDIIIKTP
ncbi:MAG: OmpA family protein [Spirochaetes bacterium]|nr:OmpA family protein [Spirochaetota bacterium]